MTAKRIIKRSAKRKWGKRFLIFALSLFLLLFLCFWIIHEPLPKGKSGVEADALAQKVLKAINYEAWEKTGAIAWEFPGPHQYLWDKKRHFVQVKWEDYEVLLNINPKTGIVKKGRELISSPQKEELLETAWKFWVNDSFWLNAPSKVFDGGTVRSVVQTENGSEALLITYQQGGATPGDSYLWVLDENGLPTEWKMWVEIIPVGGLSFTWESWEETETGAKIAKLHSGFFEIPITQVKTSESLKGLTDGVDIFEVLEDN